MKTFTLKSNIYGLKSEVYDIFSRYNRRADVFNTFSGIYSLNTEVYNIPIYNLRAKVYDIFQYYLLPEKSVK